MNATVFVTGKQACLRTGMGKAIMLYRRLGMFTNIPGVARFLVRLSHFAATMPL
jgi:hypothetical protein